MRKCFTLKKIKKNQRNNHFHKFYPGNGCDKMNTGATGTLPKAIVNKSPGNSQ